MRTAAGLAVFSYITLACWLGPAKAADDHFDFEWKEPVDGTEVEGDHVDLRAEMAFDGYRIDRWAAEVLVPGQPPRVLCDDDVRRTRRVEISCDWDTTRLDDDSPAPNGAYRLRVLVWHDEDGPEHEGNEPGSDEGRESAGDAAEGPSTTTSVDEEGPAAKEDRQGSAGDPHVSPEVEVVVANPPDRPRGVRLDYDEDTARVTMAWEPNTEPDLVGYLVQERLDGSDWALVARPTAAVWTKRLEYAGTYRFRVAAVRRVGSSNRLLESDYSEPQSGERQVEADPDEVRSDGGTTTTTRPAAEANGREAVKRWPRATGAAAATTTTTYAVGSIITNYAGTGATTDSPLPGATSSAQTVGGQSVTPIQPGQPGSVATRYADPVKLPGPVDPALAFDPGFSLTLPYPDDVALGRAPPPESPPRLLGTVVVFEPDEGRQRVLVGALAGGFLCVIIALQFSYALRRRPAPVPELPGSDWDLDDGAWTFGRAWK